MNLKSIKVEQLCFAAAFVLALGVRFAGLGNLPLTNAEADLALQALAIARGPQPLLGPHPAYLMLTSALMTVFSDGNFVARFWPALAGSLLVLAPLLYRKQIGHNAAVIMAFAIALDPGMLAVSRQASSLPLVVLFVFLALGFWLKGTPVLAGIFTGLALLGGPSLWPGLIALFASLWAVTARDRRAKVDENLERETSLSAGEWPSGSIRQAVGFVLVTVFLVGTFFFRVPNGLNAMAASIPAYLSGWAQPASAPILQLVIAAILYEFFPLSLGIWAGLRAFKRDDPVDRFLFIWWVVALVLGLIYPARVALDLTWSLVPLWALAARQIARSARVPSLDAGPLLGQALLSGVILAYISLTFVSLANNPNVSQDEVLARLFGAVIMLAAATGLIAWGWSRFVALRGLALAAALLLGVYSLAMSWDAAGLSSRSGLEVWTSGANFRGADLVVSTIDQLSRWGPQEVNGPDIAVVGLNSPSLRWALRGYKRVSFVDHLSADSSPAVVITPNQPELALAATYRGQSFLLSDQTSWNLLNAWDWYRWMIFRTVPTSTRKQDRMILWARLDWFPGDQSQIKPAGQSTTGQQDRQ